MKIQLFPTEGFLEEIQRADCSMINILNEEGVDSSNGVGNLCASICDNEIAPRKIRAEKGEMNGVSS